jgi:hypothetical protein
MTIFHMAAPQSAAPFAPPYHALTSSPFQGASAQPMGVSNVVVLKPSAVSARRDDRALPPALGGAPRGMLSPRMPFAHEQLVPLVLPPAEQARLVDVRGRGDKAPPMRRPPSFSSGVLTEQIRVGEPLRESASTPPVHPPAHHHVKRSPRASTPRGFGRNAPMRHLQQPLPMSSQGTKPYHAKLVGKHIELPPAPPASPASQRPATAAAVTAGRPGYESRFVPQPDTAGDAGGTSGAGGVGGVGGAGGAGSAGGAADASGAGGAGGGIGYPGGVSGARLRSARRVAVPGWFLQEAGFSGSIYAAETSYSTLNVLPGLPSCFSRGAAGLSSSNGGASPAGGRRSDETPGVRGPRLRPEDNPKLTLTFSPEVRTAISLDEAVDEAKAKLDKHSEMGKKLIAEAVAKQQENKAEFARCIAMREARREAFMRSDDIARWPEPTRGAPA